MDAQAVSALIGTGVGALTGFSLERLRKRLDRKQAARDIANLLSIEVADIQKLVADKQRLLIPVPTTLYRDFASQLPQLPSECARAIVILYRRVDLMEQAREMFRDEWTRKIQSGAVPKQNPNDIADLGWAEASKRIRKVVFEAARKRLDDCREEVQSAAQVALTMLSKAATPGWLLLVTLGPRTTQNETEIAPRDDDEHRVKH